MINGPALKKYARHVPDFPAFCREAVEQGSEKLAVRMSQQTPIFIQWGVM
jgi:hypothetical protein